MTPLDFAAISLIAGLLCSCVLVVTYDEYQRRRAVRRHAVITRAIDLGVLPLAGEPLDDLERRLDRASGTYAKGEPGIEETRAGGQ